MFTVYFLLSFSTTILASPVSQASSNLIIRNYEQSQNIPFGVGLDGETISDNTSKEEPNASNGECESDAFTDEVPSQPFEKRNLIRRQRYKPGLCTIVQDEVPRISTDYDMVRRQLEALLTKDETLSVTDSNNPCAALKHKHWVTCGGPEVSNTRTNVLLNCVPGKFPSL